MIETLREWHGQWSMILATSVCLWSWYFVKPRFGASASALVAYATISAIWVWAWKDNRYVTINPYDQMALRYFSCDSVARLFVLLLPLLAFSEKIHTFRMLGEVFVNLFLAINSLWIVGHAALYGCSEVNSCGGVGNPSLIVGMMVCMLPLVIHSWRRQWPMLLVVAGAVFLSKSSIAAGLLAVYAAVWLSKYRGFLWAMLASPIPLAVALWFLGKREFFSSGDRFRIWAYMMPKWAAWWNIPFGTGLGTYHVFSINLQHLTKDMSEFHWNTLHNDFLQGVFEMGAIGAALMVATYISAVRNMFQQKEWSILFSLALVGIYMNVNPMLHTPIPCLFAAWLFVYALRRPKTMNQLKEYSYA